MERRNISRLLPALAAFFILCPAIESAELVVPSTYSSIQAAIDKAVPGDTVRIDGTGTYQEVIHLKKGVKLAGSGGANLEKARIKIPPQSPRGSAALYAEDNTLIQNLVIDGVISPSIPTSAVDLGGSSDVTIKNCVLTGSGPALTGGSVSRLKLSHVTVRSFSDIEASPAFKIYNSAQDISVSNSIFYADPSSETCAISLPEGSQGVSIQYSSVYSKAAFPSQGKSNIYCSPQIIDEASLKPDNTSLCLKAGSAEDGAAKDMGSYIVTWIKEPMDAKVKAGSSVTIEAQSQNAEAGNMLFYSCVWYLDGVRQRGLPQGASYRIGRDLVTRFSWNVPLTADLIKTNKFVFCAMDNILGPVKLAKTIEIKLEAPDGR
jgi:hypothetical protein